MLVWATLYEGLACAYIGLPGKTGVCGCMYALPIGASRMPETWRT